MQKLIANPLSSKIALFAAVIGVTGVVAGTVVSAQSGRATEVQAANAYAADQCKDGGWQALGFKNQGQCVAYFMKKK